MQKSIGLLTRIWFKLSVLALLAGTALRIALLFNSQTVDIHFPFVGWLEIFVLGALNDLCVVTIGFAAVWLFAMCLSSGKYKRPAGYVIAGLFAALFVYVTAFNTMLDEYGSVVPQVAALLCGYAAVTFVLRMFVGGLRRKWATASFGLLLGLGVAAIVFNTVSEYIFWSEFGVRYNFIAVDYLVYTNEVVGNIMESYPIIPLAAALATICIGITFWLFRHDIARADEFDGRQWKAVAGPAYFLAFCAALGILNLTARCQQGDNVYINELQANGCCKFVEAFMKNELDYRQFYITMDEDEAEEFVGSVYGSGKGIRREVLSPAEEMHRNIVLITVESMSASFMERFGNNDNITPCLDSLYNRGLAFERIFATGNRTVRGLEAVTLSLPPCPGQSIVKRKNCGGRHTVAEILRDKGYTTTYFYGGDSYFDNMKAFFGGNGYEIVDRSSFDTDEITFANIWGVCDEDSYRKALAELDRKHASGMPFFAHIMTVSNHRPYTYPEGRISIPGDSKTRRGGVMYSDYALGEFMREAARREWFDNTVFVITADHCASSAGKTEIPLGKYHIPALIYAPAFIEPQSIGKTASQIDLMPTVLSLLGMNYTSYMYGRDILADDFTERAFIATYQALGYLEGESLTVLSPVRRAARYVLRPTEDDPYRTEPAEDTDHEALRRAVAYYQTAAALEE